MEEKSLGKSEIWLSYSSSEQYGEISEISFGIWYVNKHNEDYYWLTIIIVAESSHQVGKIHS